MDRRSDWQQHPERGDTGWKIVGVVAAIGVALTVLLVGFGELIDSAQEDPPLDQAVTDPLGEEGSSGAISEQAFEAVELGVTKEDLQTQLRPVLTLDARILDRFDLRSPETVSASCLYYEGEDLPQEALYRFCFDQDELVDKTFVFTEEAGTDLEPVDP